MQRLRKPLPGYVAHLDDAAERLTDQPDGFGLRDVTAETLRAIHARRTYLADLEEATRAVARTVYEQRMLVDDEAMGMLLKLARRIQSYAEDDPTLLGRWSALLDYLASYRTGGPKKDPADSTEETPPVGPRP